jgi:hypothetical protein
MEPLVLTDKSVIPDDKLIFSIIGNNQEYWKSLMSGIQEKFPDAAGEWNYYNDGKNWLFKMIRKKKTLFWIGIQHDTFRVTFYFGDKAEPILEKSTLPPSMISDFKTGRRYGKIRAITVKMLTSMDVDTVLMLAEIKSRV